MKTTRTAIIAGCLALSGLAYAPPARADIGLPTLPSLIPKARVDRVVAAYEATNAFHGAVVVVMDHGTMRQYFYGSRDVNGTPFDHATAVQIGSNTKTFTATALAYVDHYGIMDKDSPLHDWTGVSPLSPPYTATLLDLADHRSGLPRTSGDPTLPGFPGPYPTSDPLMASLNHCITWWADPCVAPGGFEYSNYAYEVLGNIISHYFGYPTWSKMNQDLITGPLAMTKTCVHGDGCNPGFDGNHADPFSASGTKLPINPSDPISAPAGGLWSTADDMGTWLRYNLGEATTQASGLIDVLRPELLTTRVGNTGLAWNFKTLTFSDGVASKVRWKDGRLEGLVSYLGVADGRDTAVFVFVNRDPIAPTSDPNDEGPGAVLQRELGEPILEQFP